MRRVSFGEFSRWKDDIKRTDSFLDVGCWSGSTVSEMNDICDAYGVDFNKETLKLVDKKIAGKVKYSDITKSIAFDRKFDWILCSEVIEHIENDEKALKNISEVMKKGGMLILTTPRSIPLLEFWDPAWVKWKFGGNERHWHYSLNELEQKMNGAGFRILKVAARGNFGWVVRRWANIVLRYLFRMKFQVGNSYGDGFVDWMILAEKI